LRRHAAVPWVLPFIVFIALLALQHVIPIPAWVRFAVPMIAILAVSQVPLHGGPSKPFFSIGVGLAVFVLWVLPDRLVPGWHHFFLFDNAVMGQPVASTPEAFRHDAVFLVFRIAISAVAVPILEELFWRGWLMRWIIDSQDFERIPLGTFGIFRILADGHSFRERARFFLGRRAAGGNCLQLVDDTDAEYMGLRHRACGYQRRAGRVRDRCGTMAVLAIVGFGRRNRRLRPPALHS
jgi:hypothetical protein